MPTREPTFADACAAAWGLTKPGTSVADATCFAFIDDSWVHAWGTTREDCARHLERECLADGIPLAARLARGRFIPATPAAVETARNGYVELVGPQFDVEVVSSSAGEFLCTCDEAELLALSPA